MLARLSLSEQLDQEIYDKGIILEIANDMPEKLDAYYDDACGVSRPYITINSCVESERERNALKAHELGHHENCICDLLSAPRWIRDKYEILADRWKLQRIMPIEKLICAFDAGNVTPLALADYLEITIDELISGLKLYERIKGPMLKYGQYSITWNPFNIKKDRRRRK
jgi:Zn-dependent peptidase ImmA (M78 family)